MRTHAAAANAYGSSRLNVILNAQARADLETLRKLANGEAVTKDWAPGWWWDRSSSAIVRRCLRFAVQQLAGKVRTPKASTRSKVRTSSSSRPKARRRR